MAAAGLHSWPNPQYHPAFLHVRLPGQFLKQQRPAVEFSAIQPAATCAKAPSSLSFPTLYRYYSAGDDVDEDFRVHVNKYGIFSSGSKTWAEIAARMEGGNKANTPI